MAVSEYEDVALRYAGSLPDGTDLEYTPRPYIVAPPLGDVVAAHEKRIAHLERIVHRLLNHCVDNYGDEVAAE